jgi:hypothetical protein
MRSRFIGIATVEPAVLGVSTHRTECGVDQISRHTNTLCSPLSHRLELACSHRAQHLVVAFTHLAGTHGELFGCEVQVLQSGWRQLPWPEYHVLVTALAAPSTDQHDFYLMLQHRQVYDDQDKRLGMDKPYIEFCGQGWSWYGHILSFQLFRDRIQVSMDNKAACKMGNDGLMEITFAVGDDEFDTLRGALGTTFKGQSYFKECVLP